MDASEHRSNDSNNNDNNNSNDSDKNKTATLVFSSSSPLSPRQVAERTASKCVEWLGGVGVSASASPGYVDTIHTVVHYCSSHGAIH